MTVIDMSNVVPVSRMQGDDPEDTHLLKGQLARAQEYLKSFKWCHGIKEAYFGDGVGKIAAVFLFRIDAPPSVDEWIWVITGDIPSCYMEAGESAPTPAIALDLYCLLMEDWAEAVRTGTSLQEVYPVQAQPTKENADNLAGRIGFIRENILPGFRSFVEE